jgi:hypothetical protein
VDRYGWLLATVRRGDKDWGAALIAVGLGADVAGQTRELVRLPATSEHGSGCTLPV